MKYEITGELIHIGEVQEFGDKGFYKRTIVINTGGEYPQEVPFDAPKKAADACRQLHIGDQVTISFDLRGRYWEKGERWFASLNAWKVEKVGSKPAPRKEDAGQDDLPPLDSEDDLDDQVPF